MSGDLFDLTGRLAVVTGSSRGLGLTLARGLGEAGATVVLNGRDEERLAAAVAALEADGLAASGCAFDVTDAASIDRGVGEIEDRIGPIDILVNNAGIQRRGPLEALDEKAWREVIDTNLTGVFLVSRRVARGMIERRRGKIVNICSLMSELGRETTANYAASKGGLKMLTRAMAVEWARYNIQANGIGPGYFLTEMTRPLADDPKFDAWIRGRTPAGRWGDPAELVGAAVFLASAASDFVNGQVIYVDGGILAAL
ncbi:MAG: gluconate 5-dehydrogenase [Planctomycetes bacterium DG_20]|nr:MAG: gluconate 5-dehydrogenase [Planctomycetes bacterium DG_20]